MDFTRGWPRVLFCRRVIRRDVEAPGATTSDSQGCGEVSNWGHVGQAGHVAELGYFNDHHVGQVGDVD